MTPLTSATAGADDPRPLLAQALAADVAAQTWLDEAVDRVTADPATIRVLFPAARRHCGRDRLDARWTVDEAARAVLLRALTLPGPRLADEIAALYRHGDAAEQRAVLRALPLLSGVGGPDGAGLGELGLPLVREALRSNDNELIAAALGPYAAANLPDTEYRQAILKCVFYEIPLARVAGLTSRADGELARMLTDFARERIAAGRAVPGDVWPVVRAFPHQAAADWFRAETRSDVPARREAATHALAALQRAA